ncbi:MAG: hypothetical protein JWM25_1908 [Thermoleophilia bacterium]|nr:hypothetical protein [Thermoleophilia bacterium]MCZ4497323.1 hypothetical protein [Thermoleophilia bacterium]
MLELIVAFVLIGIILAAAGSAIMGSFSGAADTASSAEGRADAAEIAERLGADVRGARSTGRDGASIADIADLQQAVQTDGTLYDINGNVLDWRDITTAQPNQLTVQSDVVDEAAGSTSRPECVTWLVQPSAKGWYIRRISRAYTNRCAAAGAIREDDALTNPTSALPAPGAGAPSLFSYVLATSAGGGCTSQIQAGTLSSDQRNRVVGVRIDFSALMTKRYSASHSALRDEISIRSRAATDYQTALGCDE